MWSELRINWLSLQDPGQHCGCITTKEEFDSLNTMLHSYDVCTSMNLQSNVLRRFFSAATHVSMCTE